MNELSPAVRALLAEAAAQHEPSQRELERGLDDLHAALAFSAPVIAASAASASQAAPSNAAASVFKAGSLVSAHAVKLYLVVATVIGSVGTVAVWSSPAPKAQPVPSVPTPVVEVAPVPAEEPAPAAVPEPAPARRAVRESDIGGELTLIEAAQHSLARAQPERALAQLERHARSYPRGLLTSEREGLRAVALCEAGRTDAGRSARDAFLARHGETPIAARVRRACP